MLNDYKKQLKSHIKALENSYENLIFMLNENPDKDNEGKMTLSEDKRKSYIESISKAAQGADDLLLRIKNKKSELEDLDKEKNPDKKEEKEKQPSQSLNKHLK